MENITITKLEEEQLLEMAIFFFNDKNKKVEDIPLITIDAPYGLTCVCFEIDSGTTRIHWYEFCFMHLIPKLFEIHKNLFLFSDKGGNLINNLYLAFKSAL